MSASASGGLDFVARCLAPLVAVVASPDAEDFATSRALPSFVDFLAPFGRRIEGKVHIRDSQGQSSSVDGFVLRFANLAALEQYEPAAVKKVLVDSISSNFIGGTDLDSTTSKDDLLQQFVRGSFSDLTPWYDEYRNYVCKYVGASEHETFNHPVAFLFVVSTAHPNPLAAFSSLVPPSTPLPPIFERGFLDPDIPLKHYLLVHDRERAPDVDAGAESAERSCVASRLDLDFNAFSNLEKKGVEAFVKELLVQSILPNMERKVQHWNEQVGENEIPVKDLMNNRSRRPDGDSRGGYLRRVVDISEHLESLWALSTQLRPDELEALPPTPIPFLNDSAVTITQLESESRILATVEDDAWESLEKDLIDHGFNEKRSSSKRVQKLIQTSRDHGKVVCAVGEMTDILLRVEFAPDLLSLSDPPAINTSEPNQIKHEYFDSTFIPSLIIKGQENTFETENRLEAKRTSFLYFRFRLDGEKIPGDLPETTTTKALTRLIRGEEPLPFKPDNLRMIVSSIASALSLNSRVQWRTQSLATQYPGLSVDRLRELFTLYYADDVDISLLWEASPSAGTPPAATADPAAVAAGHHYIIGINLAIQAPLQLHARLGRGSALQANPQPGRSLYAATTRERKALVESILKPRQKDVSPVRLILRTGSEYTHDFGESAFVAAFAAVLRNSSWESSVNYKLELLPNEVKGSQRDDGAGGVDAGLADLVVDVVLELAGGVHDVEVQEGARHVRERDVEARQHLHLHPVRELGRQEVRDHQRAEH
ncbi:hypothetical protein HK405_003864 [Cladochytrium tenue]|nr:hypothetical protein HK405_003864 [Cladochytrium tenue]